MTIDTDEIRNHWDREPNSVVQSLKQAARVQHDYITPLCDEIDRLRAERDWYKLALSMIASDGDNAKTVAQNALNYSPGGNND